MGIANPCPPGNRRLCPLTGALLLLPKRPRLTVSLTAADYALLAERYGLTADDRLAIKESVTRVLIDFANARTERTAP